MKNNKFIKHLADDIVQENFHLKDELVKLRKQLQNFEDLMVRELVQSHKLVEEGKAFVFQDPEECLRYFVKLVASTRKNAQENQDEIIQIQEMNLNLTQRNSKLNDLLLSTRDKLEQTEEQLQRTREETEAEINSLIEKVQQKDSRIEELVDRMAEMQKESEDELERIRIEVMEEKKMAHENANKERIAYRKQIEADTWALEKKLKGEIDKKDKEVKTMMMTINNIFQKNQVKSESVMFLKSIVKPFLDHTALTDKVSDLRKENINVKNEYRQIATKIIEQEAHTKNLESEVKICEGKIQILTKENIHYQAEYERMEKELKECLRDKEQMDQYYDAKWNTEFGRVKSHLEKKHETKVTELETDYEERRAVLENERKQLVKEKNNFHSKIAKLQVEIEENKNRVQKVKNQLEKEKAKTKELENRLREVCQMHYEELLQTTTKYKIEIFFINGRLSEKIQAYNELKADKEATEEALNMEIKRLEIVMADKIAETKREEEKKFKLMLEEKNHEISKRDEEIKGLNGHLQELKKDYISILDEQKKTLIIEKQFEKEQLRSELIKDIIREKEINIQLSLQIADIKKSKSDDLQEFEIKSKQYEKIIKDKEKAIAEYEKQMKKFENIHNFYENETKAFKENIEKLEYEKKSLRILLNSRELQIANLNEEIKEFIREKKDWLKDIRSVKGELQEEFRKLKETCERRIQYYKSRVWELEQISDKLSNKRDLEKIKSLTEENHELGNQVTMKEAENLILKEVKGYYETKVREADSKMIMSYQLKQSHPVMIKRPKRKRIKQLQSESHLSFSNNKDVNEMKKYVWTRREKTQSRSRGDKRTSSSYM